MGLKVFWTDSAINRLEDIFDYFKITAGDEIAHKIIDSIIDATIRLEMQPRIGQTEELLKNRRLEYRYLVEGNYKIIYWIEEPFVKIATVFDCRQNPVKMQLFE
jgi:plasmid stabilization system protein ParE